MPGTSSFPINTPHMPGAGPTTANAMAKKPATGRVASSRNEPTIIQSTSELMELSTGPNAQVVRDDEDAAYSRVPLNTGDSEMIQRLPKRKRAGNGWSKSKKGGNSTVAEDSIADATVGTAEVDPSKEEWAANLRRVVFEPSNIATNPKISEKRGPRVALTQSPAHAMYFPRPELVDNGISFELCDNQGRPAAVTAPSYNVAHSAKYAASAASGSARPT